MIQEFKSFAVKGNVVDMAVGIIIGAAFGKIVSSLVEDIIMPPVGLLIGGVDFSDLAITMQAASGSVPAVMFKYGKFVQTVLNFTIIAFSIFILVKVLSALKRKEEASPAVLAGPTREEVLLSEIRDILKSK
ncbi:MAG: large-conductance mechanosensitive channel protein MscL [Nitrospirae bacterium]|nr:large-conductance mechanosensitive channel protein MscL [Nitrospirota bacterium]